MDDLRLRWGMLTNGTRRLEPDYGHNVTLRTTCDDCGEEMEQTIASTIDYTAVYCYCRSCARGLTLRVLK